MSDDEKKDEKKDNVVKMNMNSKLHFGRLKLSAEGARNWQYAEIPIGVSFEDAMKPTYWAHFTKVVRPNDILELMADDGSWEAWVRVMYVGQAEVRLSKIHYVTHGDVGITEVTDQNYTVKWKGPALKFCVVNTDTNDIIKDRLYPQAEALDYLKRYVSRINMRA